MLWHSWYQLSAGSEIIGCGFKIEKSRKVYVRYWPIAPKFDRRLGNLVAEAPVKFQSDVIIDANLGALRLQQNLTIRRLSGYWNRYQPLLTVALRAIMYEHCIVISPVRYYYNSIPDKFPLFSFSFSESLSHSLSQQLPFRNGLYKLTFTTDGVHIRCGNPSDDSTLAVQGAVLSILSCDDQDTFGWLN